MFNPLLPYLKTWSWFKYCTNMHFLSDFDFQFTGFTNYVLSRYFIRLMQSQDYSSSAFREEALTGRSPYKRSPAICKKCVVNQRSQVASSQQPDVKVQIKNFLTLQFAPHCTSFSYSCKMLYYLKQIRSGLHQNTNTNISCIQLRFCFCLANCNIFSLLHSFFSSLRQYSLVINGINQHY